MVGAEWSRVGTLVAPTREARERSKRKASLKLIRSEEEEFAESVQRDLAELPTIEEKDPENLEDDEGRRQDARVRQDRPDVLHVPRLLVVGELEPECVPALGQGRVPIRT